MVMAGEQLDQEEDEKAKEEWIDGQWSIIEEGIAAGNSKVAYQTLRTLTAAQ